ncbi:MBL fold metallo-hydrolase [Salibacterium halotolerans]|uniref:L-ascorbate metabolism protein UlaG, beta-lactamase superfamily n=1 Tax=Salibacterium halotolerans TaxID=1884432 RepID=A0A1I5LJ19_9BACI|nr:MBL fold metallo-hydrolase [Salibacterium halotolerans]SFO96741.1 L-ascorbate metabolism protein UlaG, beta-lactamase superfamily [Salibacterium halotolerans]
MNIQLIRNATLHIDYAGTSFLIDPFLSEKGAQPAFQNAPREDQNNPLVELPVSVESVIDVDAVIVTHLHPDHWDQAAVDALPKDIPLFAQNEKDAEHIRHEGFTHVQVLQKNSSFEGVQLAKTEGEHGRGDIVNTAGPVSGVVFNHPDEKTLYIAGDTVWNEYVKEEINKHQPDVIVVNGGDNQFNEGGSLVMGKEDIYEVYQSAPDAYIISVHMEAVNHWTLSRQELKDYAEEKSFASRLAVPDDGQTYSL